MNGMRRADKTRLTDELAHARLPLRPANGQFDEVGMVEETVGPGFAELVLVHERSLRDRALCFCRDRDEARDLVQDTLMRALQHFPKLRPDSNVRGWLMVIMVNLYRDGLKRRRRSREVALEPWHDVAGEPPPVPAHPAPDRQEVDAALAKLPEHQRGLIEMKVVLGMRYRDIGERLGIPANTVGTNLRRARKALAKLLGLATRDDDCE